jgi:polygalacturonase
MNLRRPSVVFLLIATVLHPATAANEPLCDIADFGAVGDNATVNTAAIVAAIQKCHAQAQGGSSTVLVPAGIFVTGAFNLTSRLTLRLAPNATLAGSTNPDDYPLTQPRPTYCVCRDVGSSGLSTGLCRHQPLIGGWHLEDVTLIGAGASSVIDGRGYTWWSKRPPFAKTLGSKYGRPKIFEPMYPRRLRVQNLTVRDSPFWTLSPFAAVGLHMADLTISAPNWPKGDPKHPPSGNTDGIDLDSCSNVVVERVHVSVGDDALAIKSGLDYCGRTSHMPSEGIVIRDSTFVTHHLAIGSEMSGDVRNVSVDNCVFGDPAVFPSDGAGIFLKSHAGRGGVVEDVRFTNLRMLHVNMAVTIAISDEFDTNATATSVFRRLLFENITAANASGCAARMTSSHDQIQDVTFRNFTVQAHGKCSDGSGWDCKGVVGTSSSGRVVPALGGACGAS